MRAWRVWCLLAVGLATVVGCNQPEEKFGRTWYLDGAGNWGFGVSEMAYGLRKGGYKGQVSAFHWSLTMSPVADQLLKPLAGLGAARLAGCIQDYLRRYPNNEVNVVALSAGCGVALRAVEHIKPPYKINNLVLLAASVSCRYDVKPVLKNMQGKIYVYYSSHDGMLAGPVRVLGAFGGKAGDDPAGLGGLHPPGGSERVVNVGWQPRFERYGWHGSHTSIVSQAFVQHVLSRHVGAGTASDIALASATSTTRPVGAASGRRTASGRPSGRRLAMASSSLPPGAVRPSRPRTWQEAAASPSGRSVKRRPPVYAPPLDRSLVAAVNSPVVSPDEPATFLALSCRDPRFPSCSRLADGFQLRLLGVLGSKSAKVEVRADREHTPDVRRMIVETGQRCRGANGKAWAVTLLRVDAPSQTAWLQIRPAGRPPRRTVEARKTTPPTT